jgi:NTP pyrophosphatase (non-canonical NTP hydrolase)
MTDALASVLEERKRQDAKWGEQNHDQFFWLAILMEEVGEFSQEILNQKFGCCTATEMGNLREEAVHVAAVALSIIESMDRNQ